jgi:hypothetical protein
MTGADPHSERVVSVHRAALREALLGLGVSAALLTGLALGHPSWFVAGIYGGFALLTGTYSAVRTVLKFRRRLSRAEPLPSECVEVAPRATRDTRHLLFELVLVAGLVALLVGFSNVRWVIEIGAGLVAGLISGQLVQPLAEAHLVSRWERSHGRLFRPAGAEDDHDDEEGARLYVAQRPVPVA